MDLTTSARVKEMLESGGMSVGSALDTLISQLISTSSTQVQKYLGRHAESTSRTEEFDLDGGQQQITLAGYPVTSVTSVKNSTTWEFVTAPAIASSNYKVDTVRGHIVFNGFRLAPGSRTVEVIYEGGMGADTAAFIAAYPDIAQAVDMQVAYTITRKDFLGAQSVGGQSGSVGWSGPLDLLPEVERLLESERRYL